MKYKVEYWFRTKHDDMDFEIVTVEANSEEEAIEKAKSEAIRGSKNFKIMKESKEFGRMQELAGINNENGDGNVWGDIDDQVVYDTLIDRDFEGLISDMMFQAESNPSLTLLDYLKQHGELEEED